MSPYAAGYSLQVRSADRDCHALVLILSAAAVIRDTVYVDGGQLWWQRWELQSELREVGLIL